jgi:hypothetical protein
MLDKTLELSASIAETAQQRNEKSAVHASFVSECSGHGAEREKQEDVSLVHATGNLVFSTRTLRSLRAKR